MNTAEGIAWEKNATGEWVKTLDNWPSNRRRARLIIDDEGASSAFGNYGLSEAKGIIESAIKDNKTKDHYKYTIVPGKESTAEEKQRFADLKEKKQIERGEIEPESVESYVSPEKK